MFDWDSCWVNLNLATFNSSDSYGIIENGAIGIKDGKIVWLDAFSKLPKPAKLLAKRVEDGKGYWFTPGLIDCHTHLVYAGNRSNEFELRLNGLSYQEIAQRGGGILSTVAATRAVTEEDLFNQSLGRLFNLMAEGVTTIEIKSGYGLDLATEMKQLRVAKRFAEMLPITVSTSFLGAHAVPSAYSNTDAYVDHICHEMMPTIASEKLADAVDAFCEKIAFSNTQIERIFSMASNLGLPVKLHADQLSDSGGAMLAATFKAMSADHLEYANEQGIKAMAKAGTVAVLLPGAYYYLKEKKAPPVGLLRENRIPIALATDCNPGSSPISSIRLILNMGCLLFGLTPLEALQGVTRHAAKALGIDHSYGSLAVGKMGDLAVWDINHPSELVYSLGNNPLIFRLKHGVVTI